MNRRASRAGPWLGVLVATLVLTEFTSFGMLRFLAWRARAPGPPPALPYYERMPWAGRHWQEIREITTGVEYRSFVQTRRTPYHGQTIEVDGRGLRATRHSHCDDRPTLLMFGGSTLWGWGAPDDLTIASLLAERFEAAGLPVCAVNYAEVGRVSTQEIVDLVLALKESSRPPALVVFYDGCNDLLAAWTQGRADVESMHGLFAGWLDEYNRSGAGGFDFLPRSNTGRLVEKLARRLGLREAPAEAPVPAERLASEVASSYTRNLAIVRALGRGDGFQAAFFLQPVALAGNKPMDALERALVARSLPRAQGYLRALFTGAYSRMRASGGPGFFDLSRAFDQSKEPFYFDVCHVTPEANRVVADRMFDALRPLLADAAGIR
jgi:lysophospholipase L1-like esterase